MESGNIVYIRLRALDFHPQTLNWDKTLKKKIKRDKLLSIVGRRDRFSTVQSSRKGYFFIIKMYERAGLAVTCFIVRAILLVFRPFDTVCSASLLVTPYIRALAILVTFKPPESALYLPSCNPVL